ncbi:sarcosine oxidase subunit alpha [Bradyrhizobium genosp. SA-3]|uniref:sarcosine oxidase subunit alpha family protein n=1 Tax=Bradyrhizobium genosp. SA-3 TaxID=508868 RepID=UPI0010289BA4|nr:sarcosine oxidase subunit alpha family protein [Bradyrhizobium genosp. SA-3]RZN06367.1 sarcosine oxidase subunit alpha [Bradyrhizobium genosp. SA-3]
MSHRLLQGGHIDRSKRLTFQFDGRRFFGHPGDTLASALIACGIRMVGRSFKYHRPRGIMTAGPDEPSGLVELREGSRTEPNTKMTEVELYEGLRARSQNRWPSLKVDLMAVNALAANMISAGFYYKTFMWPASFWEKLYEPLIRRAAGLGRATVLPDPDRYEAVHVHCDVLVVGSGAAGLAGARVAGEAGARVILCERDFLLGGGLLLDPAQEVWRKKMIEALEAMPNVQILPRTNIFGYYDHNLLGGLEQVGDHLAEPRPHHVRQRYRTFRARQVVLATGASERLIAFPGNDRPGVMMAGAALTYVRRFGVAPGNRAVVFTNNDSAYATALALAEAGFDRVVLADFRRVNRLGRGLQAPRIDFRFGIEVSAFCKGGVTLRKRSGCGVDTIAADLLCISGGWNPNVHLASQSGARLSWNAELASFVPGAPVQAEHSAGAARGTVGIGEAARDGLAAGRAAANISGFGGSDIDFPLPALEGPSAPVEPLWEVRHSGKSFVDLQHDVTADDIRLAHREGFSHIEHMKRYTTHNMATDQGKLGGLVGAAILADARGEAIKKVGLSTLRPYTEPVAIGALAGGATGQRFQPSRRTALHNWHLHNSAVMQPTGEWLRPFYYPKLGEAGWAPVLREARAVRQSVGICDVSTLGKIDLQGPDAAAFLDRLYINSFSTLAVRKCRYGVMLREDGMAFDDGTISRLHEDHFLVTTTTANAAPVLEHMEFHAQAVWQELDVQLCSVSDQWAQIAVAGPRSRATLVKVIEGLDLSNEAFPFLSVGEGQLAGVPVRLFRISFSGELAYEIAVPSGHSEMVWRAILAAGHEFGIAPYGLEAMNLMRIEKGHIAGPELNGQTTVADLGLDRMMKKKGDFVGRVLSARPALTDPGRPRLVGIRPVERGQRLRGGAHLVSNSGSRRSLGWVTSVTQSIELGQWIGLAMLECGDQMRANTVCAVSPLHDEEIEVFVSAPHHVDPENIRVRS